MANVSTTAVREGDVYVVNGQKTFISGGLHADYFTTGVRTGGEGVNGISLLMIHREYPGVQCTRLKTQGEVVELASTVKSERFGDETAFFLRVSCVRHVFNMFSEAQSQDGT